MKNVTWIENSSINELVLWLIILSVVVFNAHKSQSTLNKELYRVKRSRLSLEELRSYDGFKDMSDVDCHSVIESLEKYSHILYELFINQKKGK